MIYDALFLILAHPGDETAQGVYHLLAQRHGKNHTLWLSAEELALAVGWEHRIDPNGAHTQITLPGGAVITGIPSSVFNRLLWVPAPPFPSQADREYANQEMVALWWSWLANLPRVMNPPSLRGLCGPLLSQAEWLFLASQAGLPTLEYMYTSDPRWQPILPTGQGISASRLRAPSDQVWPDVKEQRHLLLVGDCLLGEAPEHLHTALTHLGARANCPLLGIELGRTQAGWLVCNLNAVPEVIEPVAIQVIVEYMERQQP